MQNVISVEHAKKITGGRTPLVPVEYETAIQALIACQTLEESKYWSDKADALAAWAKIYRSKAAEIEAKKLKLHAYRRMGELARTLQPHKVERGPGRHDIKTLPGPTALLKDFGLSKTETISALRISRIPECEFEQVIASPRPPAPSTLGFMKADTSAEYKRFMTALHTLTGAVRGFGKAANFAINHVPKDDLSRRSSTQSLKEKVCELIEWLDEFEHHLPK